MSYNIVSFCGGGIRGLMSAEILNQLWTVNPNILSNTNLFAGTSTGSGIISLLLSDGHSDPPESIPYSTPPGVISYFEEKEVPFFGNPVQTGSDAPWYDINTVHDGQLALHGLKMLSEFNQSVLFTSFNARKISDDGWTPILYSNLPNPIGGDAYISEAVTSSSAMPGMLGPWMGNVDGAFVNHDPTIAAIALAMSQGVSIDEIAVICIGTGFMPNWLDSDISSWGANQWQNGDPNISDHIQKLLVGGTLSPMLSLSLNGTSSTLMPTLMQMMLKDRYVNINPTLPFFIGENDVSPEALDVLRSKGRERSDAVIAAEGLLTQYWGAWVTEPADA